MEKVKGLGSTNWQLQHRHGDVKYSTGNPVNSSVVTMWSARWVPDLWGERFANHINV